MVCELGNKKGEVSTGWAMGELTYMEVGRKLEPKYAKEKLYEDTARSFS